MAAFYSLIGGIKGIGIILLVIVLGGYVWTQKRNADEAIAARDVAIQQRDSVVAERDKAIAAAKTSDETVKRLEQEKDDINQALNSLAQAKEINRGNTITREVIIQSQATVAANSAQAAPVLGAIVEAVQNDRVRRRPQ